MKPIEGEDKFPVAEVDVPVQRCRIAAGGFLSLSGKELRTCRKIDMLTLMADMKSDKSFDLQGRFAAARELFPHVAEDAYYLSKIWVNPA